MKTVWYFGSLILIVYSVNCNSNSDSILLHGDKTCWNYIPLKSKFPFDYDSGICFFSDGECFDYVTRSGFKIPFGNEIVDVSEYHLEEILSNWRTNGDSLFIGRRRYFMSAISEDTILIETSTDSILLVIDNTHYETYWGHVIDSVPKKYID